jgi:dihydroflavonol-4-reductase
MKITVTGAAGHLGNNLVRALAARGDSVRALVLPSDSRLPLAHLPVEIVEGDVTRLDTLLPAFEGADVVFHLASVISLLPGNDALLRLVNVGGAANVAEACLRCGVRRLVHTSSIHALYEPAKGTLIDEQMPFDPAGIHMAYGKSKALGSQEILKAVAGRGLDAVIVCPTGVIGPNDFRPSEMGQLFIDFARGRMRTYVEGAYDFVDVRDVCQGMIAAAERGHAGENYILSGELITVQGLLTLLRELTGAQRDLRRVPAWAADAAAVLVPAYCRLTGARPRFSQDSLYTLRSNAWVSHDKATRELGFEPRSIRESIAGTLRWFAEAGMLVGGRP